MRLEARGYSMEEVFAMESPDWLIEGMLRQGQVMFLNGQPKTGKSLFALRVAAAVTSGTPLWGHEVRQGKVWYLAAERAWMLKERAQGLIEAGIPLETSNMKMYPKPVAFLNNEEVVDFANLCGPTDLLIVDTLRRCFQGGRENDNNDMTFWVSGVERFCEETGAAALVIHHNQRPTRDAHGRTYDGDWAGGGALLGSVDVQLKLTKDSQSGVVTIKTTESNDLTTFEAQGVIKGFHIGGGKTSGVMIEVDSNKVVEAGRSLKELVVDLLQHHSELTPTEVQNALREHPETKGRWKLSKSTISDVLKELEETGDILTKPHPRDGRSRIVSLPE